MNARIVVTLLLSCCALPLADSDYVHEASAEWYRPLTWGDKQPTVRPKKKSTGVVGDTRRAIAKTADVLTPWDNRKKKDNPHDGAARFFRPDVAHRNQKNDAVWYRPATWLRSEPQPEQPLTVTDWMAQDRPEFENR